MGEDLSNRDEFIITSVALNCARCGKTLCLRKQVINLALGSTEELLCLLCLSHGNSTTPQAVLTQMKDYVLERQCFQSQWIKYENKSYCPEPDSCFPDICFGEEITMPEHELDLRGVACPMNFVKTKLILDKMEKDALLCVCLDEGEPFESVKASVEAEGHQIASAIKDKDGSYRLSIRKCDQ